MIKTSFISKRPFIIGGWSERDAAVMARVCVRVCLYVCVCLNVPWEAGVSIYPHRAFHHQR